MIDCDAFPPPPIEIDSHLNVGLIIGVSIGGFVFSLLVTLLSRFLYRSHYCHSDRGKTSAASIIVQSTDLPAVPGGITSIQTGTTATNPLNPNRILVKQDISNHATTSHQISHLTPTVLNIPILSDNSMEGVPNVQRHENSCKYKNNVTTATAAALDESIYTVASIKLVYDPIGVVPQYCTYCGMLRSPFQGPFCGSCGRIMPERSTRLIAYTPPI